MTSEESDDVCNPATRVYQTQPEKGSKYKNIMSRSGKYELTQALLKVTAHSLQVVAGEFKRIREPKFQN